jgi:hypothetical protein
MPHADDGHGNTGLVVHRRPGFAKFVEPEVLGFKTGTLGDPLAHSKEVSLNAAVTVREQQVMGLLTFVVRLEGSCELAWQGTPSNSSR